MERILIPNRLNINSAKQAWTSSAATGGFCDVAARAIAMRNAGNKRACEAPFGSYIGRRRGRR
jgi:hypothetical protein